MDLALTAQIAGTMGEGLRLTLLFSSAGILGALALGLVAAALEAASSPALRAVAQIYIEVMRNTPLVVKLFFLYFAMGVDPLLAGIAGLAVHQSGFIANVLKAGIGAVPREQLEAARSTGLAPLQVTCDVLLPQALRLVLPPLGTQFIEVVKNSSVVMIIGVAELTYAAQNFQGETFRYTESFAVVTVIYVAIALAIAAAMHLVGKWLRPA